MDAGKPCSEPLVAAEEVVQVGTGIVLTAVAVTLWIEGRKVFSEGCLLDVEASLRCHQCAMAGNAGRQDTVAHIDAVKHRIEKIVDGSDTHEVAGLFFRKLFGGHAYHAPECFLVFTNGGAADGIAGKVHFNQLLGAVMAQILMVATLYDAEDGLLVGTFICLFAALGPAKCPQHRLLRVFAGGRIGNALVERHHDIGADAVLDMDRYFRRHEHAVTVEDVAEGDALFGDLPCLGKGEYLEAAGIRQHRSFIIHEFMNAACLLHHFFPGSQPQVIRVGQYDACMHCIQLFRGQELDGRMRSDRHEHRCFHVAVRRMKDTGAGTGLGADMRNFKCYWMCHSLNSIAEAGCIIGIMKSQIIRVCNIPKKDGVKPVRIHVKPTAQLIGGIAVGAALMLGPWSLAAYGIVVMGICLFALFLPDRTLVEFYPDFLVLYNQKNPDMAYLCLWKDIVQWRYEYHTASDRVFVELVDGSTQSVDMFGRTFFRRCMNLYAPGKEVKSTRMKGENA